MRVLIATGIFEPEAGGPATYAPMLAAKLTEAGNTAKVLTYSPPGENTTDYTFDVVRVVRTKNKIANRLNFFRAALREIRGQDLVYTLDWFAAGLPVALAARLRGIPYVVRIGGDYAWEQRYLESGSPPITLAEFYESKIFVKSQYVIFYFLIRWVLRGAAHIIFNSDKQRTLYRRYFGLSKDDTSVIYNPVPTIPKKIERGSPTKEFVFWGRFIVMKNIDTLIRAFERAELSETFTLTLIGEGPRRLELEDLTYELTLEKRVRFEDTKSREEVLRRVCNARAAIVPSWTDISPNQVYEALAMHLPALVTKENYLSVGDRLPATIDPHSIDDIAKKLRMLADDKEYEAFSRKFNAISFAHDWGEVVREHLTIFKRLLS